MRRVREQRHLCGSRYMEVDYFSISEAEHRATARAKRERASRLVQKNLNARNACRHLVQLVNTNFGPNDLHLSLTYDREHLPGGLRAGTRAEQSEGRGEQMGAMDGPQDRGTVSPEGEMAGPLPGKSGGLRAGTRAEQSEGRGEQMGAMDGPQDRGTVSPEGEMTGPLPGKSGGEEADRILMRYLRRLAYRCRKKGVPAPAYIAVTEYRDEGDGGKAVRPHHHVILRCALSREEIEDLWSDRQGRRLGLARADRLQPDHESLEALARYITKYPSRRHRWHQSRGLRQPVRPRPNDSRVKSQSRLDRMARERVDDREFWEKMWPGWHFECCVTVWNETTAQWSLYCKFWREGTV